VRLVFAGTPDVAVPSLEALLTSRHEVVAVVTRPDAAAGRGRARLAASPVAQRAAAAGLTVLKPARVSDPQFLATLRELAPDCAPVVAYGALVPPAALAIPTHGWVNLHFSLLPAWRGAAPVQRAVLAGDEVTGATTFRLDEDLDTGPTSGCLTETVRPRDTAGDLLARLATAGAALLLATLDGIEDATLVPAPQPADGVSLAPKVSTDEARVDWHAPAFAVDRLARAMAPHPGAWTTFRGQRCGLGPVVPLDDPQGLGPGEIRVGRREVLVGTATAAVRLGEVRPAGKRAMPAGDWARGARPAPGERFAADPVNGGAGAR
jgi:methionyl-tRNA formyltransferase